MEWVIGALAAWFVGSLPVAILVGKYLKHRGDDYPAVPSHAGLSYKSGQSCGSTKYSS